MARFRRRSPPAVAWLTTHYDKDGFACERGSALAGSIPIRSVEKLPQSSIPAPNGGDKKFKRRPVLSAHLSPRCPNPFRHSGVFLSFRHNIYTACHRTAILRTALPPNPNAGTSSALRLTLLGVNVICFGVCLFLLALGTESVPLVLLAIGTGLSSGAGLSDVVVISRQAAYRRQTS